MRREHPHRLRTSAAAPRHGHPACGRPGLMQVRRRRQELRQDSHASGASPREPVIPPPSSRRVYKPLIPSYKRCSPCQGSGGACCHSRGWKAAPASVCGYCTSCSGPGADGGMAHLTGSRPSKDEGGGRVCAQRGRPRSPAAQRQSKRTRSSLSSTHPPQVARRHFCTRVIPGQVSSIPLNLYASPASAEMPFI